MGKKKDTKTLKVKKKRRNPLTLIESKFPDIPISLYIIVPLAVGTVLGVNLINSIPLGFLCGLVLTGVVWFGKEYIPEPPPSIIISYTPDDIVMSILNQTWFVTATPADIARPEAYSVDGQRWSHKLEFTTEYDDKDVFIVRGSLVTGEAWLEHIPNESEHEPEFWQNGELNSENETIFVEENNNPDNDLSNDMNENKHANESSYADKQSENNTSGDNDSFDGLDDGDYPESNTSVDEANMSSPLSEEPVYDIILDDTPDRRDTEQNK